MAKVPLPGKDILAGLHKKHGRKVFSKAIDTLLPREDGAKPTIADKLAKFVLLRLATKSVPGAIVVGGGILAKHLHTKHKERKAHHAAKDAVVDVTPRPTPRKSAETKALK